MYIRYGDFDHDIGEAAVVITRQRLVNAHGLDHAERVTWDIQGILHSDPALGQTGLTGKISALMAAYRYDGGDLYLLTDEGTLTAHALLSGGALGGTRIIQPPSFPVGSGVEYASRRTYRIVLEADYRSDHVLLEWTETISWTGALGPEWIYLPLMTEPPQRQQVAAFTTFKATQAGRAAGNGAFVFPPGPIWPAAEHQTRRKLGKSVRPDNSGIRDTTWQYEFEHIGSLRGVPHAKSINS